MILELICEIETSDLIFDIECTKCRRPANSDECVNGLCPDCVESEAR